MRFVNSKIFEFFNIEIRFNYYLFLSLIYFLLILLPTTDLDAQVRVEKTWNAKIRFNKSNFSPKHTYGVANQEFPCELYDLKSGNLIFKIDTTQVLITDYTGKTFFVKDSINQKFYVYDISKLELIKELPYRNYITIRAVSDSTMFEFDTTNQIITLWNVYEDRVIMKRDLKKALNYSGEKYKFILDQSFDGRFIRLYEFNESIYDSKNDEFIMKGYYCYYGLGLKSKFMNLSNSFILIEKMKIGNDTIESEYFRFFDLESRSFYKNIKIKNYKNTKNDVMYFLLNSDDDYILYYISEDFFSSNSSNIYDIVNDKYNDRSVNLSTIGAYYFGNSLIIDYSGQAFKVLLPTSIPEYSKHNELLIFPNPATDFITINLSSINPTLKRGVEGEAIWIEGEVKVEIYDVMGVLVAQTSSSVFNGQTGTSDPPRIDISHLSPGVYFVKIHGSNGACSIVEKFVKY